MGKPQEQIHQEVVPSKNLEVQGVNQPMTLLQSHYLGLLQRLVAVKNSYQTDPKFEPWLMKAINKAIYAALRDCIEENIGGPARELLHREHQVN
jgi:hypothetical protein